MIFRERGEGEIETLTREKHPSAASCMLPPGIVPITRACALSQQPLGAWDDTQPTKPHWWDIFTLLNVASKKFKFSIWLASYFNWAMLSRGCHNEGDTRWVVKDKL